jgi:hypothetical protein
MKPISLTVLAVWACIICAMAYQLRDRSNETFADVQPVIARQMARYAAMDLYASVPRGERFGYGIMFYTGPNCWNCKMYGNRIVDSADDGLDFASNTITVDGVTVDASRRFVGETYKDANIIVNGIHVKPEDGEPITSSCGLRINGRCFDTQNAQGKR